jgi:hypothetical protein
MKNYFEVNDDHLCGAVNCFEKPTMEIKLKVGQKQMITLHVCAKCVNKFGIKPQQTGIDAGACDSVCYGDAVSPDNPQGDVMSR